jgi:transcriptional regulator with XRE-family HTH domain
MPGKTGAVVVADAPGDFAQQLRALREAQGMSVRALANLVGVSSVTVWKWESGGAKPRGRMIGPLAKALNVLPAQLQSSSRALASVQADNDDFAEPGQEETVDGQSEPLAEVIARAKQMIADASGTGSGKITILIEY